MKWSERKEYRNKTMAVSVTILVLIIALHLIAFVFAIGAERRRSEVTLPFSLLSLCLFFFFDSTLKSDSFSVFRRRCSPTSTMTEPSAFTPPTPPPSTASPPSLSWSSARPSSTPSLDAYAAAKGLFPVAPPLAPSYPSSSPGNNQLSEIFALSSNCASKQLNP